MSEFEYGEEFAADPTEEWQAAYDSQPVEAVAALAQSYAAQYAVDPNQIAAQALVQMQQLQQMQMEQAALEREAQDFDRSMAAAHGANWTRLAPQVGAKLAASEDLQKRWSSTPDAEERLQILDELYRDLDNRERSKTFREIQSADSGKLGL